MTDTVVLDEGTRYLNRIAEKEPATNHLVLLVDDTADNIVLISIVLQQQGYRVVTASNGEEAVRAAVLAQPDVILMDIGMPQLDGFGAARKIKEHESLRAIPIIAITAFNTDGFRRAAYDAGFEGYLTKPLDFDRLHELIQGTLKENGKNPPDETSSLNKTSALIG